MNNQNNYALVTGANRGIGKAISLLLAEKGFNLLLVARGEEELSELVTEIKIRYGVDAYYLAQDLSMEGSCKVVSDWVTVKSTSLTVLVNNAGYGLWGEFAKLDLNDQLNMLQLNIAAVLSLTHRLLPVLNSQTKAYILNVGSTAAYQAMPTLSVYAASKAFVLSFSRGLRYELRESSVSVSCLSPGPTDTGFASRAGLEAFADLAKKFNMTPEEVARIGISGMLNGKAEIVPGFVNRCSSFMVRFLPKSFIERISAGLYRTK